MIVSGSLYVSVICTNLSLLWLNNIPLYICSISLFLYRWHLGCFHVLAIVHSAEMNTGVRVFFKLWFTPGLYPGFTPGLCPAVELLGHMVILFFLF